MFRTLFMMILGVCITSVSQAQIKLEGDISSSTNVLVADAMILLQDSLNNITIYDTTFSDSLGHFTIFRSDKRANQLLIRCLGYKQKTVPLRSGTDYLKIVLEEDDSFELNEVVVRGIRRRIKIEDDRMVYDIERNPFKDDNAIEAFKYVPFIASDGQHFSIIGKSETKIYVNGREKKLSPGAVGDYLKGLPANQIKRIEVIHSPNSSFRGEGNFGIINILLKYPEDEGLQGMVAAQLWHTHFLKERGNLNMIYRQNKLTMNFTAGLTNQIDWRKEKTESFMKQTSVTTKQDSKIEGHTRPVNIAFDWEYQLSGKNVLGGSASISKSKLNWNNKGILQQQEAGKPLSLHVQHNNELRRNRMDASVNLFYRNQFNSEQTLSVDADYIHSKNEQFIWNRMDHINENSEYLSPYKYYQEKVPQISNVWSGKVEYGHKAGSNLFSVGLDSYYSNIDNKDTFLQGVGDDYVVDNEMSNHFVLKEWTSSLFLSWKHTWSPQLTSRLGSRLEYTDYSMQQYTTGRQEQNHFFRVLPSLYINYQLSPNHIFSYVFSNRIERPAFSLFNPFKVFTSATSYTTGNEKLKPEVMYGQTLQYQFFKRYVLQATYQQVKHQIYELTFATDNNLQVTTPVNSGKFEYLMLALNTNFTWLKSLADLNITVSYLWQHLNDIKYKNIHIGGYRNGVFQVNLNNNFTLSKQHDLSLDINFSYNTKDISFYTETPEKLYLYGQLKKRFQSCQLSLYGFCNLYRYDGLITTRWRNLYETENMTKIQLINGEPVGVGIRFNYYFGNKKIKGINARKTSGSEVRKRLE